jgi:galactosyltransferase
VTKFACAIAIGPDSAEIDRVADLIDSLRVYESGPWQLTMVDDSSENRSLATRFKAPPDCSAISIAHPRRDQPIQYRRGKGICAAILAAFSWIARNAVDARFVLKLDTDALVIAPFAPKLAALLERNPDVGMTGAYDRSPGGEPRDFSMHAKTVEAIYQQPSPIQQHIRAALAHGYRFGEHCLGGAYAVSNELLKRMLAAGYLDDPKAWLAIDCPEDVMIGMYTKAVGLKHMNSVAPGEVFGVRYKGLPDEPAKLIEVGYSVIHSVKNDPRMSEEKIREFFRRYRRP